MTWQLGAGLDNRTFMVTGAAGGIGRAVSHALAGAGARVCTIDVSREELVRTVDALPGPGPHLARPGDVADLTNHERLSRMPMNRSAACTGWCTPRPYCDAATT